MQCKVCGSRNQTEFNAEINVHFPGLKNVDKPAVLVFPKLLLCPDCGFTEFTLSGNRIAPPRRNSAFGNARSSKKAKLRPSPGNA
jgi:hypothetical protein